MPDGSEKSHRVDGITVLGTSLFIGETIMGGARDAGTGAYSVMEFGAVGDGVTDDSVAFQRALNATTVTNPRLVVPAGLYKITVALTCATPNLEMVGVGATAQDATLGNGTTQILVGAGIVGFTFDTGANAFRGPVFRNLYFKDNASGTATGGMLVKRTSNFQFDNCVFAGFTGASSYGLRIDGTNGYSQYGKFTNCGFHKSKIGCDVFALSGGHRFVSCDFSGNSNSGVVATGTTGLKLTNASGNHADVYMFGCVLQEYETCVSVGESCDGAVMVACRFEVYTTGIDNSGDFTRVIGCAFSNSLLGGGGSPITNQAAATRAHFFANHITTTNNITDSGSLTTVAEYQEGFRPATGASVACLPKAGIPGDGDFMVTPVSGMLAVDTTNSKLYVRVGSTWKSVTVA